MTNDDLFAMEEPLYVAGEEDMAGLDTEGEGMNTTTRTLATPENMRAAEKAGKDCFAYSPLTFEQYSGTPGDYFRQAPDEPIVDSEGEPMILAVKVTRYLDALTGDDLIA